MKLAYLLSLLSLVTITSNSTSIPSGPLYHECNQYRETLSLHKREEERINRDLIDCQETQSRHRYFCTGRPCASCDWYGPKIEVLMGQHKAHHMMRMTLATLLEHKEKGHDATTSVRCTTCAPNASLAHDHLPKVVTTVKTITSSHPRPRAWYHPLYWRS